MPGVINKKTVKSFIDLAVFVWQYAVETQGSSPIYRKEHSILETASL